MRRRDFLQGSALTLAAGAGMAPLELLARQDMIASTSALDAISGNYPPALTGLRGSHPGSFEVAHDLAWNGKTWPRPSTQTDDTHDLIVVGGGISGLSAAHFYRQRIGEDARILILDNHDDFGGHARRNEFTVRGRSMLCYGGSQSIESPRAYSNVTRRLLDDLGIEARRFYDYFDSEFDQREGLDDGILFRQNQFGRDALALNAFSWFGRVRREHQVERTNKFPVSEQTKAAITALASGNIRETPEVERMLLAPRDTPVEDFLRAAYGFTDQGLAVIRRRTAGLWGVGLDALSVRETIFEWVLGGAADRATYSLREDALEGRDEEQPYIFHFPDGNASIARLLVRSLVPGCIPGSTMEDVVTARADYRALDRSDNLVRIRLNSTAVEARNRAGGVDVTYVNNGGAYRARAQHCVLACYNRMIPYLCPEIDDAQREALLYPQKVPLVSCHTSKVASERTERANARSSPQGIPGVLPRAATPQWRAPFAPAGRVPLGPWPRCAPWQWDAPFPAGRASPQTKGNALMRLYSRDTTLGLITVALDNWRPIKASGISSYEAPSGVLSRIGMDFPVSMGDYKYTASPDEPCVLQGWHAPACGKQGTISERFRAGRMELYQMPFSQFEEAIKDELNAAWGPQGLDVDRDIKATTVNRWPHGYAHEYMDLWDDHSWNRGAGPHIIGRQQIGAISIANSDSEQHAYVNGAIDSAHRAVRELTTV